MGHSNRISKQGIDLIKGFEGLRRRSERVSNQTWIVGYGHTRSARDGVEVTEREAEYLLRYDLQPVEEFVSQHVHAPLNQNEFDALVSLCWNIGQDAFANSDILNYVNAGEMLAAAESFSAWRKARLGGRLIVVDALVRRRSAEKNLFLSHPSGPPSAPSLLVRPELDVAASVLALSDGALSLEAKLSDTNSLHSSTALVVDHVDEPVQHTEVAIDEGADRENDEDDSDASASDDGLETIDGPFVEDDPSDVFHSFDADETSETTLDVLEDGEGSIEVDVEGVVADLDDEAGILDDAEKPGDVWSDDEETTIEETVHTAEEFKTANDEDGADDLSKAMGVAALAAAGTAAVTSQVLRDDEENDVDFSGENDNKPKSDNDLVGILEDDEFEVSDLIDLTPEAQKLDDIESDNENEEVPTPLDIDLDDAELVSEEIGEVLEEDPSDTIETDDADLDIVTDEQLDDAASDSVWDAPGDEAIEEAKLTENAVEKKIVIDDIEHPNGMTPEEVSALELANGAAETQRKKVGFFSILPFIILALLAFAMVAYGAYEFWTQMSSTELPNSNEMSAGPFLFVVGSFSLAFALYFMVRKLLDK